MTEATPTNSSRQILKDRYRLVKIIGQGGMAVVWRAEDTLLQRQVAIKILRDQYARDPEFLTRFRSEARSAASLNHPGIVGVYDVGEDDGRHYLVMEYVLGRDLKQIIREQAPLEPARTVRIATELAEAVGEAHRIGLVHRDIKPQNVLVSTDGRMKIADFGIARAIADAGMTQPGIVLGTVHYLAPEQAGGKAASPASDVYALGVVIYEMLAGQVPHTADSGVGVAMKILHEEPRPISEINSGVPEGLAEIVGRAMAREPGDRYQSSSELAEALNSYSDWLSGATQADFQALDKSVLPAAGQTASSAASAGGTGGRRPPPSASGQAPRRGLADLDGASESDGPLLDRTGLFLGVVALIAIMGLIPLWRALADRLDDPRSQSGQETRSGTDPDIPDAVLDPPTEAPTATPTPQMVEVPDVEGIHMDDAKATMEAVGLGVSLDFENDASGRLDHILRQLTDPGSFEERGSVIKLVASGHKQLTVPNVSGTFEEVQIYLEDQGFTTRPRYFWKGAGSSTEGGVIGIEPQPGAKVPFGSPIYIEVDAGPYKNLGIDYQDFITLRGISIDRSLYYAGDSINITPNIEISNDVVAGNYRVRAELWDAAGNEVARAEGAISADGRPSNSLSPGEKVVGETLIIPIPAEATVGAYGVWMDLFPVDTPEKSLTILQNSGLFSQSGQRIQVMPIQIGTASDTP